VVIVSEHCNGKKEEYNEKVINIENKNMSQEGGFEKPAITPADHQETDQEKEARNNPKKENKRNPYETNGAMCLNGGNPIPFQHWHAGDKGVIAYLGEELGYYQVGVSSMSKIYGSLKEIRPRFYNVKWKGHTVASSNGEFFLDHADSSLKKSIGRHSGNDWQTCNHGVVIRRGNEFIVVDETGQETSYGSHDCYRWGVTQKEIVFQNEKFLYAIPFKK
jgi:hypothetical protein